MERAREKRLWLKPELAIRAKLWQGERERESEGESIYGREVGIYTHINTRKSEVLHTLCTGSSKYTHTCTHTHVQANGHGDPSRSQSFRRAFKGRTTPHSAHRPPMDRAEAKGQKVSLPVDRCCHLSLKTARLGTLSFFFFANLFLGIDAVWRVVGKMSTFPSFLRLQTNKPFLLRF